MSIKTVTTGDVIRDCRNLESYIIVDKNDIAIFVVSLIKRENPSEVRVILLRDMDYWIRDCDIDKLETFQKGVYTA